MKVSGVGTVRGNATRRASGKARGDGSFRLDAAQPEVATSSAQGAGSIPAVGALLSLQEVPDATDERSRGLARGRDLLEELEQIRLGLLLGRVPRARLAQLQRLSRQRPHQFQDPNLQAIMLEIEVRAAVELAKLEKSDATSS